MGKALIIIGAIIVVLGLLIHFMPKMPFFRLPGDIVVEKENFRFYFPIVTSILLSIIISLVIYFVNRGK